MPKSNSTMSLPSHSKQASDEPHSRMSDVALRKKKNADAQAAFRARRANYIATLEETVTSLESVVLQLQESCREARHESQELRQENARLRHEFREREKFWRTLWQAKKTGQTEADDPPPLPASFSSPHPSNGQMSSIHMHQYGGGGLAYRISDDASICNDSYETNSGHYHNHASSLSYAGVEAEISGENPPNSLGHRGSKYSPFTYPISNISREAQWPSPIAQSTSSIGDSGGVTHSSHSPGFTESPTSTSTDISFVGRFPPEDQKVPLSSLDTAPYAFPSSRSISPTSTPGSSSSTPLTPFQFTFSGNGGHERSDLDYRRHPGHPHGAEVTLHGGTADISLVGPASDAVRYRLANRRDHSGSDRPLLPVLPPMSGSDNGSQQEQGSSDGDSTPYLHSRSRLRRGMTHSRSRSRSPPLPVLSGTLAVIKAQAFGALRRTRARTKKSSQGAAKVAMNVLEARGIGMASSPDATPSLKRPRIDDDLDVPHA